jgi:hypothetical protein
MKWILALGLLAAVALVVAALATIAWQTSETHWFTGTWRGLRSAKQRKPLRVRCLPCHGTGRRGREPERTMNFLGGSFEDRHGPATPCPDCRGRGVVPEL